MGVGAHSFHPLRCCLEAKQELGEVVRVPVPLLHRILNALLLILLSDKCSSTYLGNTESKGTGMILCKGQMCMGRLVD